ncbi:hypothetical protein TNCV_2401991 [Trichonephila clavipes]|nr:hypothetical protein TNCV_2401991 [Trichonephila clavipes]
MGDSKVKKWVRELKDRQTNIRARERSGRLSVIPADGFGLRTVQSMHCTGLVHCTVSVSKTTEKGKLP